MKFDSTKGVLTLQKMDIEKNLKLLRPKDYDKIMSTNVIKDLQQSYDKYCKETVIKDIKYFFEEVLSNDEHQYTAHVTVGSKRYSGANYIAHMRYTFYPVFVRIDETNKAGETSYGSAQYEVLRIPYMDEYGKLTTRTGPKVCLGVLKPSEDAAYDASTQTFNIAMPNGNVRIEASSTKTAYKIRMLGKRRNVDLINIIIGMLYDISHDKEDENKYRAELFDITDMMPKEIFVSNVARNIIAGTEDVIPENLFKDVDTHGFIVKFAADNNLTNDIFNLGKAREALNELYDLSAAEGQIASRPILDKDGNVICDTDQRITKEHIKAVKRACKNVIYVWDNIDITGYKTANYLKIDQIEAGTKNNDFLRLMFPEHAHEEIIQQPLVSKETVTDSEGNIRHKPILELYDGTVLTPNIVEFLKCLGFRSITCIPGDDTTSNSAGKEVVVSFEREIVGNHFARLGDLREPRANETYNDWVYTFNNPQFFVASHDPKKPLEYLTVHDLEAIFSDICRILTTGYSDNLLNRDDAFLKRISMIDETFSKYFRQYVERVYGSGYAGEKFVASLREEKHMSRGLTQAWITEMNKGKVLTAVDSTNIAAELCQVIHANIQLTEPPDSVRRLAIPYYGRICPFETPAGKPLGLVNTRASGCRIGESNLPEVPYYKIINKGGRPAVNYERIHWINVKDEHGNKFVDCLELKVDDQGLIEPGYCLARIPNPEHNGDPFIVSRIPTTELINTDANQNWSAYVNVYPEQMLSPTACLIPFAASDDSTRITYGLSQLKQTIYLADSEPPRVTTDMYEDIFSYFDSNDMRSPVDGTIATINGSDITILGDDGFTYAVNANSSYLFDTAEVTDDTDEDKIIDKQHSDNSLCAFPVEGIKVGVHVEKDQKLLNVGIYPKQFLTRSPVSGEIIKITTDEITIKVDTTDPNWNKLVLNPADPIYTIPYQGIRILNNTVTISNLKITVGQHVKAGDILIETNMSRNGKYSPSREALMVYIPYGYNHEDGVVVSEKASEDYTSVICHSIRNNISSRVAKRRNIFFTDSFKYHVAGEQVASIHGLLKSEDEEDIIASNDKKRAKEIEKVYATNKAQGIILDARPVVDDTQAGRHFETYMLGLNKLGEGDKMAGRHGNKGVVSKVVPNSEMPQFMNGVIPDVIKNPHGTPSRMNVGKILEMHLGLVAHLTGTPEIKSNAFNGATTHEVQTLVHFCYDYMTWLRDGAINSANDLIQHAMAIPEFKEVITDTDWLVWVWDHRDCMIPWINAFNRDGTAKLYDPVTDTYYNTPVLFGWVYYNKLVQEADEKIVYRAGPLEEQYNRVHTQSLKSETSANGQRLGEMELVTLAAYGASNVLDEVLNEKSDNMGRKYNLHAAQLRPTTDNGSTADIPHIPEEYCQTRSAENLIAYLYGLGVYVDTDPEAFNLAEFSKSKYSYDFKRVAAKYEGKININTTGISDYRTGTAARDALKKLGF